jgi:hypothetical protein
MEIIEKYDTDEAKKKVKKYYSNFADQLGNKKYLFSNQHPTLADFSVFHLMWYKDRLGCLEIESPSLKAWYERIKQINQNNFKKISGEEALDIAKNSYPIKYKHADTFDIKLDRLKLIPKELLGVTMEAVEGVRIDENENEYVLEHSNKRVGIVHIHFPKKYYGSCM